MFLVLGAAFALAGDASLLTQQEWALVNSCDQNFTQKVNSPDKAADCLEKFSADNYNLLDRLQQYSDTETSALLMRLIAVKDLADFLKDAQDKNIQHGLIVRLERKPCVLCTMELGPQPEKLYSWVTAYRSERLPIVKEAGLDWDTLSDDDRQYIGMFAHKNREQWLELPITVRKQALTVQAPGMAVSSVPSAGNEDDKFQKYSQLGKAFTGAAAAGGASAVTLGHTFDNSNLSGYDDPLPSAPGKKFDASLYTLTDDQAAKLGPRLVQAYMGPGGELSGTKVGDELAAFSRTPDGAIKLSVESFPDGSNGDYSSRTGKVRISRELVQKAMLKYGITAEQLMDENNTDALNKVTRYTAPVFVHEYGGHQMQNAWVKKNGISDLYYMDMETDAFSKQSLFVLQKRRAEREAGNTSYNTQVQRQDVLLANKLKKEGFAGVGREVLYYEVPSRDGRAAMNFARFEEVKKELTARLAASQADPAAEAVRDAARPAGQKTAELQNYYNSIYPWYKLTLKKTAEDNAYYKAALKELDA